MHIESPPRSRIPMDVIVENDAPVITLFRLTDGDVVIQCIGTLKSPHNVIGPYTFVDGASSLYVVEPSKTTEFFVVE